MDNVPKDGIPPIRNIFSKLGHQLHHSQAIPLPYGADSFRVVQCMIEPEHPVVNVGYVPTVMPHVP